MSGGRATDGRIVNPAVPLAGEGARKPGGELPKLQFFLLGLLLFFGFGVLLRQDFARVETGNYDGMQIIGELIWMTVGAVLIICALRAAFGWRIER